ncbi:MAG: DUF1015 domain-containing protein [Deltaproteobacteria bacterium]|jgi:uncharacterized protein (DUF1015 family)|nr:MAG: DUF1015 domain-containing protein [Deltaproteobacteria bacterium]
MAIVAPFRALRFNPRKLERLEDVVTPPYDIIDEKNQAAFQARNPYNMIFLDISKSPGKGDESEERYNSAKNYFTKWQEENVLIQDDVPAIYLYNIDYTLPSGILLTRKGLVALVGLAEFSEGIVKPHEETFATVTADRLRLMDTCQAQFSQIFSLYAEDGANIIATLEQGLPEKPLYEVKDADGGIHSIWPIADEEILAKVQGLFHDKSVYIADGHHRYSTSLRYRNSLNEKQGELPPESPYNFTMMYLCPMEDPGLTVLPTHRLVTLPDDVLPGLPTMDELVKMMAMSFELEEVKGGSREILMAEVLSRMDEKLAEGKKDQTMFGLYHAAEDRCFLLTLKEEAQLNKTLTERPSALRDLDVVVLSDLVVEGILGIDYERRENENLVRYYADPDEALDVAVKESIENENALPLLFLMNNTKVLQVKRVADENLIMPHKSTYFYPKILTGLLLNKLNPDDEISIK